MAHSVSWLKAIFYDETSPDNIQDDPAHIGPSIRLIFMAQ